MPFSSFTPVLDYTPCRLVRRPSLPDQNPAGCPSPCPSFTHPLVTSSPLPPTSKLAPHLAVVAFLRISFPLRSINPGSPSPARLPPLGPFGHDLEAPAPAILQPRVIANPASSLRGRVAYAVSLQNTPRHGSCMKLRSHQQCTYSATRQGGWTHLLTYPAMTAWLCHIRYTIGAAGCSPSPPDMWKP